MSNIRHVSKSCALPVGSWHTVERFTAEPGLANRWQLWPDKSLGSRAAVNRISASLEVEPEAFDRWLEARWNRISELPD